MDHIPGPFDETVLHLNRCQAQERRYWTRSAVKYKLKSPRI
jgi:hypothetical protein